MRAIRLLLASLLVVAVAAAADGASITVSLDTTSLQTGLTGPYFVDFQLIDGDGVVNNTVQVSNVDFGGGGAVGLPLTAGDVSGDLAAGVAMGDTAFFNAFSQEFTPGSALSFVVNFTTNLADVTPDRFTFAILNAAFVEVPTVGPGNELLGIDLRQPIVVETYPGVDNGTDPVLAAPELVPEPASFLLVGLATLWALRTRRRHA